jgi:subtilisin family serine protease
MHKNTLGLAIGLGLSLAFATAAASAAEGPDPNRVWVKFKKGSRANVEAALRGAGGRIHFAFDQLGAFAVTLPPQALAGIRNNPNVELVEQDAPRYSLAQGVPYGIDMVQARDVWDADRDGQADLGAPTGAGITVCVIDSGIHRAHEDFAGVAMTGGVSGWDNDTCGHGSHVAGTIAAANNQAGVVGVNPGAVSLHIMKVFNGESCGWSYSSSLIDAANKCAQAGAKVINMSLGGATSSTTEQTGFANLYSQGVLSIAAAGNAGTTQHSYPASYDSVVSVAAIDSAKVVADFSQRTSQVELAAPGVGVLSTVPFVSAGVTVAGQSFQAEALEGSFQGSGTGALVNGGLCSATDVAWAGKVVLCERGTVSFADKVNNAANSGAAAVAIYNNVAGGFSGTLGGTGPALPAVSMAQADGQFLVVNRLGSSATVSTVANNQGNGYAYYDGTSMATPHVAGVAALVWSANPGWTNVQVRQALGATAEDLGTAGRDTSYGWGLVSAKRALDLLQGGGGTDPDPVVAKVGTLSLTTARKGKNYTATATPRIVDGGGAGLAAATVTGCFSGAVSGCSTATTTSTGSATFKSAAYRAAGPVTFCVTNVTGPNDSFDATSACRTL